MNISGAIFFSGGHERVDFGTVPCCSRWQNSEKNLLKTFAHNALSCILSFAQEKIKIAAKNGCVNAGLAYAV